jgi:hypothetical protein
MGLNVKLNRTIYRAIFTRDIKVSFSEIQCQLLIERLFELLSLSQIYL